MKASVKYSLFLLSFILLLSACGTTENGVIFTERSVDPATVAYKRVAILPNRLPLNLTNPEKWKQYNFEIMRKRFEREGLQVIDYASSVEMFNKSGLPLEDTKISRDKYAELAEEMGADILIFPYYGTSFRISGITDKYNYEVTGSLQIYFAGENDFITRIDFEGNNYYRTFGKITPFVSAGLFALLSVAGADEDLYTVGAIALGAGNLAPLIPLMKSPTKRWQKAFDYGINKGLDQFFAKYRMRTPSSTLKPVQKPVTPATTTPVQSVATQQAAPPSTQAVQVSKPVEKPLSYYSVDELEKMKQDAINAKDFRKAQAIKEEIDKRTK